MTTIHGYARLGRVSTEFISWSQMIQRCCNPNNRAYQDYGGRGIFVCVEWLKSFSSFLLHIGMRPGPGYTVDRIDNDRGYEPGNVRWATWKEQQRNRRGNRLLTFRGETHCIIEWAEITGLRKSTIRERLHRGWSIDLTLTVPAVHNRAKTHCAHGHAFTPENIYSNKHHKRLCKTCRDERKLQFVAARVADSDLEVTA